GIAWGMRSIAYGAFLGLDGQPEAAYFADKLKNSLAWMEGELGIPLDITDTPDRTTSYHWGLNTWEYSQGKNVSPLGALWDAQSASYAQNGAQNNVNPATLSAAGSMFQEAFLDVTLGMINQLGLVNTNAILTFLAKRPIHTLIDPTMNHYLIQQYCYPMKYTNGSWVADWGSFQSNYLSLPTNWAGNSQY